MHRVLQSSCFGFNEGCSLRSKVVPAIVPTRLLKHWRSKENSLRRLYTCRFQPDKAPDNVELSSPSTAPAKVTDYNTAHEGVQYISCEELNDTINSFAYILDVQSRENFVCLGHVPSAACKNIPVHEFMSLTLKRVSELLTHKDDPVVVLSNRGRTAASVQLLLTKAFGFSNVVSLQGGMEAWRGKGFNIEHGTDCAIINAHCPWIDNNELLCSLQMQQRGPSEYESSEAEHTMFR